MFVFCSSESVLQLKLGAAYCRWDGLPVVACDTWGSDAAGCWPHALVLTCIGAAGVKH